jgi:hypothetical protein
MSDSVDDLDYFRMSYYALWLNQNSAFRNVPSGTVFKVDCTSYSADSCTGKEDHVNSFSMYSLFNELDGEWIPYT